jgi:hypothetical protein
MVTILQLIEENCTVPEIADSPRRHAGLHGRLLETAPVGERALRLSRPHGTFLLHAAT